jgi:hypothetical protein
MKAQSSARSLISPALLALLPILAAGCERSAEQQGGRGSTTPTYQRDEVKPLDRGDEPVRIGELGPNFPACYAMARLRERVVTEAVPVRSSPSEQGRETARMPLDRQFFICTRSHDQRWFAIVWDPATGASPQCGVSRPLTSRREYGGPCESGWIPSALVRLESGIIHDVPVPAAIPDTPSR